MPTTKLWRSIASVYQAYNLTEKAVRHRNISRIFASLCTYALWEKIANLALRNWSNLWKKRKFQISVVSSDLYGHNSWSQCSIQINLPRGGEWLEIYEISYMCNAVKKWPAPSWLFSSVDRALHRYRRGHGFKSLQTWIFFQVSFLNYWFSCVHSCEDRLYLFSSPQTILS